MSHKNFGHETNENGYGSGHETATVLLPGFAINWQQNQVTRQPQFLDLTHMPNYHTQEIFCTSLIGHLLFNYFLRGADEYLKSDEGKQNFIL